jgi:hypothetical protein
MTDKPVDGTKSRKSRARSARLAAALRENLRRRKAQERQRGTARVPAPRPKPDPAPREG